MTFRMGGGFSHHRGTNLYNLCNEMRCLVCRGRSTTRDSLNVSFPDVWKLEARTPPIHVVSYVTVQRSEKKLVRSRMKPRGWGASAPLASSRRGATPSDSPGWSIFLGRRGTSSRCKGSRCSWQTCARKRSLRCVVQPRPCSYLVLTATKRLLSGPCISSELVVVNCRGLSVLDLVGAGCFFDL